MINLSHLTNQDCWQHGALVSPQSIKSHRHGDVRPTSCSHHAGGRQNHKWDQWLCKNLAILKCRNLFNLVRMTFSHYVSLYFLSPTWLGELRMTRNKLIDIVKDPNLEVETLDTAMRQYFSLLLGLIYPPKGRYGYWQKLLESIALSCFGRHVVSRDH